jgi:hypothetical protein
MRRGCCLLTLLMGLVAVGPLGAQNTSYPVGSPQTWKATGTNSGTNGLPSSSLSQLFSSPNRNFKLTDLIPSFPNIQTKVQPATPNYPPLKALPTAQYIPPFQGGQKALPARDYLKPFMYGGEYPFKR